MGGADLRPRQPTRSGGHARRAAQPLPARSGSYRENWNQFTLTKSSADEPVNTR